MAACARISWWSAGTLGLLLCSGLGTDSEKGVRYLLVDQRPKVRTCGSVCVCVCIFFKGLILSRGIATQPYPLQTSLQHLQRCLAGRHPVCVKEAVSCGWMCENVWFLSMIAHGEETQGFRPSLSL